MYFARASPNKWFLAVHPSSCSKLSTPAPHFEPGPVPNLCEEALTQSILSQLELVCILWPRRAYCPD